ncbi:hypothetical protein WEI85_27995 [Actinomycetes bacterium KLBMP 9797]
MKIYADRVPTAIRQLITDLLVVAWVYVSIRAALWVHDLVEKLAVPGQKLEGAGNGIADNLADVSGKIGRVPVVGDDLTSPFEKAAGAARSLSGVGQQQQDVVNDLALAIAVGLLIFPLGLVLFVWLPLRLRWMRRAGAAAALRSASAGRDLLALRALANQPLRKLNRIDPDVVQAWRRGDESTVEALAALELSALGLRAAR